MIPDGLPTLSFGGHKKHDGLACAMEYVSVIAGEEFSDHPICTHGDIASAVISVNDGLRDDDRHLMLPLIPRLVGADAAGCLDFERAWAIEYQRVQEDMGILSPRECCPQCTKNGHYLWYYTSGEDDVRRVEALTHMLDWYDEYTGRTTDDYTVTSKDVTRAAELIGAK